MATSRGSSGESRGREDALNGVALLGLELQQIQTAESRLSKLLPSLADAVESESLRDFIELREEQGKRLIGEIEASFEELEEAPPKKKNLAAEGLIEAAEEHIREMEEGPALDAAVIADIQKVEHYCIAAWGTARSLAEATGRKTTVHAMEKALKEGKSLDEKLSQLAEKEITPALLSEETEEEEGEEGTERPSHKRGRSGKHSPQALNPAGAETPPELRLDAAAGWSSHGRGHPPAAGPSRALDDFPQATVHSGRSRWRTRLLPSRPFRPVSAKDPV